MYEFLHHLRMKAPLSVAARAIAYQEPYGAHVSTAFLPVSLAEIEDAEKGVGGDFPEQLKTFYLELGAGTLHRGPIRETSSRNYVIHPGEVRKMLEGSCQWTMPYTKIQPGTLPFFERDVDLFLCLHPSSENPNAVHWMWGEKICDSLVEFFQRLVEDPDWFNPPTR